MCINISRRRFINEDNFRCTKFVMFESWIKVRATCVTTLFVVDIYTLQQLVSTTFKFWKFLYNFMHCCVWHVRLSGSIPGTRKSLDIHSHDLKWFVIPRSFCLYKCCQYDQHFLPLANPQLFGSFLASTAWNLLCTVTADPGSWSSSLHLVFRPLHSRRHIFSCVCVCVCVCMCVCVWDVLGWKMWKVKRLHHEIYSNTFIFHSCAFNFASNFPVKWYAFYL
jgi:hypothetical protein